MTKKHPYRYRAFICHASENKGLAEIVRSALERVGLDAWLDARQLKPGKDFAAEIQHAILSAHLFVPVITAEAKRRPWVNQEIGFAQALNVPVLPVGVGIDAETLGMIYHVQAISVPAQPKLPALIRQLENLDLLETIEAAGRSRRMFVEIASQAIDRPQFMVRYGERALAGTADCRVRQRAYYTSFSIPDKPLTDPIWERREHKQKRMPDYLRSQRAERQIMEKLARRDGCRLIIDPRPKLFPGDRTGWRARIEVLEAFLRDMPDSLLEVMTTEMVEAHNLVLVGDQFLAEADSRVAGQGYQRTHFSCHAPSALVHTMAFDEEFDDLCKAASIAPSQSREFTREKLVQLLSQSK